MELEYIITMVVVLSILPSLALATAGPRGYLTEQVKADFDTDGSISSDTYSHCHPNSNPCRYGFVEASVPNNDDVLQNVKINLSKSSDTDLNSNISYKGALVSSSDHSRSQMYVNTSGDGSNANDDSYFNISDPDKAPMIRLNLSYTNYEGGIDVYDEDNIGSGGSSNTLNLTLSITNPGTIALSNVDVAIQFELDTKGSADSLNITTVPSDGGATGTPSRSNSDGGDNYYDKVTWTGGSLPAGQSVLLTFNATFEETVNLGDGNTSINLDEGTTGPTPDKGAQADYGATSTLTGRTMVSFFAKGPIRQGIDMKQQQGTSIWHVRGLIRNMATSSGDIGTGDILTYNITQWRIYEVNATGHPKGTANQTGNFNSDPELIPGDGRVYSTDSARSSDTSWFNTSTTTKPYYASYFDWEVIWDTTNHNYSYGYINTTYDLPTLYKIDMSNQKSSSGYISPDTGGEVVTITDESRHTSGSNSGAKFVEMLSLVPVNTTDDNFHGNFTINETSLTVYFRDSSASYTDITGDAEVLTSVTQPAGDGSSDGLVNVTIGDTSAVSAIGHYINGSGANDEGIKIEYDVISHENMTTGDSYNFTANCTMKTSSGTPLTEPHPTDTVSVSAKRLIGYKDLIAYDTANPTLINGTLVVEVQSTGSGDKISGIKFIDYVPKGTDLFNDLTAYKNAVSVRYYNGSWYDWSEGTDYNITDNGMVTLPGGATAYAYEFINASGDGWSFGNGEKLNVTYRMNITTSGVYTLPMLLSGFDPVTGKRFSARPLGSIEVRVPKPMKPLEIDEGKLKQAKKAVVGKPVLWMKDFQVYNPNSRATTTKFKTKVFPDTSKGYATYYNEKGEKIEESVDFDMTEEGKLMFWESKVNAMETRNYDIRVLTPPIVEVDRDVEVLKQLEGKRVKIKMDVHLKNFAEENYKDVILNLPIGYENIIEARNGYGEKLKFTGGKESSTIYIGDLEGGELETITILYKQSYPTIIVTPKKEKFSSGTPVGLSILVINGGEEVEYPYIETEIYTPGMDVVKSDIKQIDKLKPLEKTELSEKYLLPVSAPTGTYLASARFREDFATLASGTGKFFLKGKGGESSRTIEVLIIIAAIILLGYLSYKRFKEVRKKK